MKEKTFPGISMFVVWGTMLSGSSGVLLAVGGPVSIVAVPEGEIFLKGNSNVRVAGAVSVLEI